MGAALVGCGTFGVLAILYDCIAAGLGIVGSCCCGAAVVCGGRLVGVGYCCNAAMSCCA